MKPGDRLVCAFVEPYPEGERFSQWPFHITIVPWFRLDMRTEDLVSSLVATLKQFKPFTMCLGGEAHFGHYHEKLVRLVDAPTPLLSLEKAVRGCLHGQHAWIVDESTLSRRSYLPHVTAQRGSILDEGYDFLCEAVYVIEQLGAEKYVAGKVSLV